MEKHCTSVYFNLKKTRKDKNGASPIVAYISVNCDRVSYYTGKKIKASEWDENKQLVKDKAQDAYLINEYLHQIRKKLYQKENELLDKGFLITPQLLKDALSDKVQEVNDKTICKVFDDFIEMRKALVGKKIVKDTFDNNVLTGRYLKDFMQTELKRKDMFLREVKIGFIQGFHNYLMTVRNNSQNSCAKHLTFLKQLMNSAVANGFITYNPFAAYKVERDPVEIDFLADIELRKIINFDTPIKRFERTRDAFLFGCFTGLAYIDIKTLRKEHFETDEMGRIWIKKKRVKTGVLSRIPLLPMAKLILEKYKDCHGEMVIPIQDCTDVNENLKDIAILCGINKHVTFHTSRHTFASTVTLANNISMEVIAKMMGHTNTRMTARYAKLVDKAIGEQMDKIIDNFSN